MIVVLIIGKAESGKDTLHKIAERNLLNLKNSYTPIRLAFADEVKNIAYTMGWDGEKDEKGRSGSIFVGDGARKYFDENIWVNKLKQKLSLIHTQRFSEKIVFITDCRYPNEVTGIKEWGKSTGNKVLSVKVIRPNHISRLTVEQLNDPSETSLDNREDLIDYTIMNNGSLHDFERSINDFIYEIALK